MMYFLLPFKVIFYILRNKYQTFKDFCIAYHIVVIATFHKDIVTHTSYTFLLGLMTKNYPIHFKERSTMV